MTHLKQALQQIKRIESERTLLKGHFSKIAKQYGVSVTELKKEWGQIVHNHAWIEDDTTGGWACNCGEKLDFGSYNAMSRLLGPPVVDVNE